MSAKEEKPTAVAVSKPMEAAARSLSRPVQLAREVIAVFVWAVLLTELLIFDIIGQAAALTPYGGTVLQYRLLVLMGLVSIFWIALGTRRFLQIVGYILAYPFVILLWKLPRFLLRNWVVAVAFSPAIHAMLTQIKLRFVLLSAALISGFLVCLASNATLIGFGIAYLGCYLVMHFGWRFRRAFSPSTVFADFASIVPKVCENMGEADIWRRPKDLDEDPEKYEQALGQKLMVAYAMTSLLHGLGEGLRQVARSHKLDAYLMASLIYTFLVTVVIFGVGYLGLERIIPGSFSGAQAAGLLDFVGLSFSTVMTADISSLKPLTDTAKFAMYTELVGTLLIAVLLVFVLLTSSRERYKNDLDEAVRQLRVASDNAKMLLETNYELTLATVEVMLLRLNPLATKWLLKFQHGEKKAIEIANTVGSTAK